MGRLIEHIKRWNVWRKYNKNGITHKILVLFGIIKSPTFFNAWTSEEAKAFYDGFMKGLKDGNDD
jgi:hypothetical protein